MLALAAMALAAPLGAQAQQVTKIEVPASKKWQHAHTGLIVPQTLGGLARTGITDSSNNELDVAVQFGDPNLTHVTLYLFRPALMSVPMWFDRIETQIRHGDVFGDAVPTTDTLAFVPPKASAAAALRRVYKPGKASFSATGAAVLPLGEWLVAIRLSSSTLDPAALDAKLTEVVTGLQWPAPKAEAAETPAAAPIQACASPLAYSDKAKLKKPDMTMALIGAALVNAAQNSELKKTVENAGPANFCREGSGEREFAAYRALPLQGDSYLIAIADAGRTISVQPALQLDEKRPGYSVTVNDLANSYIYPPFDKLPAPARVMEAIGKTRPISSTTRSGKDITINAQ
ncbi:MAG: hypothetical protein ABW023_13725 [Sphingomonas sp.]